MPDQTKLPAFAQRALGRLDPSVLLIRTSSDSDEAVQRGGGFLYSIEPGGRKFPDCQRQASHRWRLRSTPERRSDCRSLADFSEG